MSRTWLPQHLWTTEMGFGKYIRNVRENSGYRLNEFAELLEISPAYWSRIERELEKAPRDELICKSAELLGVKPDEAYVHARRLPPDMIEDLHRVVTMYRRRRYQD
jgi:HTH-type transcriptional regulator, competence development regulator